MIKTIFLLILFSIIIGSCDILSSDWSYAPMRATEILSITDSVRYRQPIEFEIKSAFNTPCYEYGSMLVDRSGFEIDIGFIQKMHKRYSACATVLVPYEINESLVLSTPGQYIFHFIQTDSTTIDTMITVY